LWKKGPYQTYPSAATSATCEIKMAAGLTDATDLPLNLIYPVLIGDYALLM
jgi:hypothetical protein